MIKLHEQFWVFVNKLRDLDENEGDKLDQHLIFTNGVFIMQHAVNGGECHVNVKNVNDNVILKISRSNYISTPYNKFTMVDELISYINSLVEKCVKIKEEQDAIKLIKTIEANEKVYEFLNSV
jgi:hypothetical protein